MTQLKSTDEELETIWNAEHSLADFTAPSNFKSYDEVKTRLDAVLSGTVVATKTASTMIEEDETPFVPDFKSEPAPQPALCW